MIKNLLFLQINFGFIFLVFLPGFSILNVLRCVSQVSIIINGSNFHLFIIIILLPEDTIKIIKDSNLPFNQKFLPNAIETMLSERCESK